MQRTKGFTLICNIFLPILVGGIIYIIADPYSYPARFFFGVVHVQLSFAKNNWGQVLIFLRNYGCDFLWAYALNYLVDFILWDFKSARLSRWLLVFVICTTFGSLLELCQRLGLMRGTFDVIDILAEALAGVLAGIKLHYSGGKKENEKVTKSS